MRRFRKYFFAAITIASLLTLICYLFFSKLNQPHFPKYHFVVKNIQSDFRRDIEDLETKMSQNKQGAIELSSLATLQISQARATGDLSFYQKAELNAERSLRILPHFNDSSLLVLARVAEAKHQFDKSILLISPSMALTTYLDPSGVRCPRSKEIGTSLSSF